MEQDFLVFIVGFLAFAGCVKMGDILYWLYSRNRKKAKSQAIDMIDLQSTVNALSYKLDAYINTSAETFRKQQNQLNNVVDNVVKSVEKENASNRNRIHFLEQWRTRSIDQTGKNFKEVLKRAKELEEVQAIDTNEIKILRSHIKSLEQYLKDNTKQDLMPRLEQLEEASKAHQKAIQYRIETVEKKAETFESKVKQKHFDLIAKFDSRLANLETYIKQFSAEDLKRMQADEETIEALTKRVDKLDILSQHANYH